MAKEYVETVDLLGQDWEKYNRAGSGYLYELEINAGPDVARNKVQNSLGVPLYPGSRTPYRGELAEDARVEILDNGNAHIISENGNLKDLLEEDNENPFA